MVGKAKASHSPMKPPRAQYFPPHLDRSIVTIALDVKGAVRLPQERSQQQSHGSVGAPGSGRPHPVRIQVQ